MSPLRRARVTEGVWLFVGPRRDSKAPHKPFVSYRYEEALPPGICPRPLPKIHTPASRT